MKYHNRNLKRKKKDRKRREIKDIEWKGCSVVTKNIVFVVLPISAPSAYRILSFQIFYSEDNNVCLVSSFFFFFFGCVCMVLMLILFSSAFFIELSLPQCTSHFLSSTDYIHTQTATFFSFLISNIRQGQKKPTRRKKPNTNENVNEYNRKKKQRRK